LLALQEELPTLQAEDERPNVRAFHFFWDIFMPFMGFLTGLFVSHIGGMLVYGQRRGIFGCFVRLWWF